MRLWRLGPADRLHGQLLCWHPQLHESGATAGFPVLGGLGPLVARPLLAGDQPGNVPHPTSRWTNSGQTVRIAGKDFGVFFSKWNMDVPRKRVNNFISSGRK